MITKAVRQRFGYETAKAIEVAMDKLLGGGFSKAFEGEALDGDDTILVAKMFQKTMDEFYGNLNEDEIEAMQKREGYSERELWV